MPMFDYKCGKCSHLFEELIFSSQIPDYKIKCPKCGAFKSNRQLSAPTVSVGSSFDPACEKPGCTTSANSGFG